MQKSLCIAALTISLIVFVLFLADLILGHFMKSNEIAPFKGENADRHRVHRLLANLVFAQLVHVSRTELVDLLFTIAKTKQSRAHRVAQTDGDFV